MTCDRCGDVEVVWVGYPRKNDLPLPRTDLCAECRAKENL